MKDFLVYHNPDSMGVDVRKVDPFAIVTNKPVTDDIIGSRVWLLTASGRPRIFLLRSFFIVDQVDANVARFQTKLSAASGKVFDPMIELNNEQWFRDLKKSQGNFAFGLQRIQEKRFVLGLEQLAASRP